MFSMTVLQTQMYTNLNSPTKEFLLFLTPPQKVFEDVHWGNSFHGGGICNCIFSVKPDYLQQSSLHKGWGEKING